VDVAEDEILGAVLNQHAQKLGGVRRLLARLRRHVNADRAALGPLPGRLLEWLGTEHSRSLRHAVERLDAVAQDLELVQERARLLQEEIAARLSEATNRNLFVLSVVTVALLPITLITGIFGMNVGGLPWLEHPRGFWRVTVLMLAGVCGAMTYMIRKKVFR
jgi:zinc transporter